MDSKPTVIARNQVGKSRSAQLEKFRAYTAGHPLLLRAYEELKCAIRDSNPGSIIFIYGPTGVGKTTLLKRLEKHLKETMLNELESDCERVPVATVQLVAPTSGNFDWKDYFKRLLIEFEEPLVDSKLNMDQWEGARTSSSNGRRSNIQLISNDKPAIRTMRFACEQTLRHRRPLAVLLDDAQHFGIISSGRKLLDQLNTIKSLADKSLVTHVLCGTYELIPLRNLNGQLSRSSIDIHFGRYHVENKTHKQEFINVLNTFQQQMPLAEKPDLVSKWDYFYERSLGCVGVLKDWLTRSLALALENNSTTLPLEFLERRALSINQCITILNEAVIGEREMREEEGARQKLRGALGLKENLSGKKDETSTPSRLDQPSKVKTVHHRRRVGTRNPARDKIGIKKYGEE